MKPLNLNNMNEETKNSEAPGPVILADDYRDWLTKQVESPYYLPRPDSQIVPSQWYSEQERLARQRAIATFNGPAIRNHYSGVDPINLGEYRFDGSCWGFINNGTVQGSGAFTTTPAFKDGLDPKNNNYFE